MIHVAISQEFCVTHLDGTPLDAQDLHDQGDELMDALLELEECNDGAVCDATTSTDAEHGIVTVDLVVAAADTGAAMNKFLTVVRTGIHQIGGSTPRWEDGDDSEVEVTSQYEIGEARLRQLV